MKLLICSLALGVVLLLIYLIYLNQTFDKQSMLDTGEINKNITDNPVSDTNMLKIRPAAVAGMFYPADKEKLSQDIISYLQKAKINKEDTVNIPRIILVPHAGYEYSGTVAAYGYKIFEGKNIKTVLILGSSHNFPISGIITDGNDSWETPFGRVELDKELIDKMQIPINSEPFFPEHSLEVQLPFLQKILPEEFKIVPILVGDMDQVETQQVAYQIAKYVDKDTAVVISSDMSHYPSYDEAVSSDKETINSILTGDTAKFKDTLKMLERKNIPNAATFMCAQPAVTLGMVLAKTIEAQEIKLINYANSGDVTDDKSRVVGYSAIGFFRKESEQNDLISIARESIETYIKSGKIPNFDSRAGTQNFMSLQNKSGVFVTLKSDGNLRGCIGLIESDDPLYKTIPQMAVAAAVNDPRFSPVTKEDLLKLEYEVSVLSPMKKINQVSEIELGKHGVKVQNNGRSGVFLPQVADETNWSKEEFLNHLCQDKAGLSADCWKDPATEIYTFTAHVFSE